MLTVIAASLALCVIDLIFGSRFGLGKELERGRQTMGQLAFTMVGIILLSPVIADLLEPIMVPVYKFLGAAPAMFTGSFFACDMDETGKVIIMEFTGSAVLVFGDHPAYTAGYAKEMILPTIIGKLSAGVLAVALAFLLTRKHLRKNENAREVRANV